MVSDGRMVLLHIGAAVSFGLEHQTHSTSVLDTIWLWHSQFAMEAMAHRNRWFMNVYDGLPFLIAWWFSMANCECHNQMVSVESIQRYQMEDVETRDVWVFNGFHDLHDRWWTEIDWDWAFDKWSTWAFGAWPRSFHTMPHLPLCFSVFLRSSAF